MPSFVPLCTQINPGCSPKQCLNHFYVTKPEKKNPSSFLLGFASKGRHCTLSLGWVIRVKAQLSNKPKSTGFRHTVRCHSCPCRCQHGTAGWPRLSGAMDLAGFGFPMGRGCLRAGGWMMSRDHDAAGQGKTHNCRHRFPTTNPLWRKI